MKIELGGGINPKGDGYVNVDLLDSPLVDIRCDFEKDELPFDDNTITEVYSAHCFEHLQGCLNILREIVRVCKDGAGVYIRTPYATHALAICPSYTTYDRHYAAFSEWWWEDVLTHFWNDWFKDCGGRIELNGFDYTKSHKAKPLPQKFIDLFDTPEAAEEFAAYHFCNWIYDFAMKGTVRK